MNFRELNNYAPYPSHLWVHSIPFVNANSGFALKAEEALRPGREIRWYVNIAARNGIVHQKYSIRWVNGKHVQAIQVFRHREGTSIYDRIWDCIDDDYPIEGDGYITQVDQLDASGPLIIGN